MGRNTKMANRAASRQKDGRWGPPGPSPLKQVTLPIRLVDDILIANPVVVLADVLLVCTSGSAELSNPHCQPCDALLAEPDVECIDYLPSISTEVVICKHLVVLGEVYSTLSSPIDMVDDYVVVAPMLPSDNSNLIDTTLEVVKTVHSWVQTIALFVKEHATLFYGFFHQKFVNIFVNSWAKWYLAIISRFLNCYFLAPSFIRSGIG